MQNDEMVSKEETEKLNQQLDREATAGGYHLNPDVQFTKELVEGLIVNERRYSYRACPCRLAAGVKDEDLDIICPCDYRDADLDEHDACFCGLYVSKAVVDGTKEVKSIPERRAPHAAPQILQATLATTTLPYPVWRCRVCGYLCARRMPPETCPICKAKRERFEKFIDGATKRE
jgi:ferredoxin-thioredoxin reductase catalytic subunit